VLEQHYLKDSAAAPLAGQRIDAADPGPARFPSEAMQTVRQRLAQFFVGEPAGALACSAAFGADLIALEEAERLGLGRRVVLPFAPKRFCETSLVGRGGGWGRPFDRFIAAAAATGDPVLLPSDGRDVEAACGAADETIIRESLNDRSRFRRGETVGQGGGAQSRRRCNRQFPGIGRSSRF
jgi:hypothetical protein